MSKLRVNNLEPLDGAVMNLTGTLSASADILVGTTLSVDGNAVIDGKVDVQSGLIASGTVEMASDLFVAPAGKMGIGVDEPSASLHVAGATLTDGPFITPQTLSGDVTVPSNHSARLFGPTVTVAQSVTITMEDGSRLRVDEF